MDRIGRRITLTFLLLLAGVGLLLSVVVNEYAGDNECKKSCVNDVKSPCKTSFILKRALVDFLMIQRDDKK